jgi:hypothetical protein
MATPAYYVLTLVGADLRIELSICPMYHKSVGIISRDECIGPSLILLSPSVLHPATHVAEMGAEFC